MRSPGIRRWWVSVALVAVGGWTLAQPVVRASDFTKILKEKGAEKKLIQDKGKDPDKSQPQPKVVNTG